MKVDACPGRLNSINLISDLRGVYYGQCSELCGAQHAFIPIAVEFVRLAMFSSWLRAVGS